MRGGIDKSAFKGENEDNADLWDKHNFDVGGRRGQSVKRQKGKELQQIERGGGEGRRGGG